MVLVAGQLQIRELVMGAGTSFVVGPQFNPFRVNVRANAQGRPWGHGGLSGAEWANAREVPLQITPVASSISEWLGLHQQLAAAFQPVGDTGEEVELRWHIGGREYVLFGRTARFDPNVRFIPSGSAITRGLFRALDPLIYDGTEQSSGAFGLPTFIGGLEVPFTVPFTVDAVATDGEVNLLNEGTADTGLILRIDGPVQEPRVTLQGPSGEIVTLRFLGDIPSGRFLLIDTARRTALLDGVEQASRRGQMAGDWPLLPGNPDGTGATSTLLFRSADNNDTGTLIVSHRSAWW